MEGLTSRLPLLVSLALACASCSDQPPESTATIDPSTKFQTIDSWEATAKLWEFDKRANRFDGSWLPIKDQILRALIEEGGINRLRLELRSGTENPVDYWTQFQAGELGHAGFRAHFYEKINDNDDPQRVNPKGFQFSELDFRVENLILPAMRIAAELGRPMTFTLCFVDFDWTPYKGTLSHARNPEEYAELIDAAYAHLEKKYGLVPSALEIILEPDNSDGWGGAEIGKGIVAVTDRLAKRGVTPRIIAPSTSTARKAPRYFDELTSVKGAAEKLSVLSYHRYDGRPSDELTAQIAERARKANIQTAMLEYTHSDIDDLIADLTHGNVSSWQKYGIAMLDDGNGGIAPGNMLRVTDPTPGKARIALLPGSIPLANLFRAVDPGAVRIGATTDKPWLKSVAFTNPDGRMVVSLKARTRRLEEALIMLHRRLNTPLPTPGNGQWATIRGLKSGRYLVQRANWLDDDMLRCTLEIKPGGTTRVFLRGGDAVTVSQQKEEGRSTDRPCSAHFDHWE